MDFKDYYATLGVAKTATEKEIKQAFRKLARKHHPDVNPGDKAAEAQVQGDQRGVRGARRSGEAEEVRRARRELAACTSRPAPARRAGGRQAARGTSTSAVSRRRLPHDDARKRCSEMFGDGDPFSDFFHTFFGGGGGRRTRGAGRAARRPRPRRAPGPRRRAGDRAGLEDAYHGATRRLSIKHDGQARTVDVRIPAGVGDGSRVRVAGEGEHGRGGAQSGDLYLRIRLAPHPTFERKGQRSLHARRRPADDGGARRRGRGARRSAASRCG